MKAWLVSVSLALLIALSSGYPVPEDESHPTGPEEDRSQNPSVSLSTGMLVGGGGAPSNLNQM